MQLINKEIDILIDHFRNRAFQGQQKIKTPIESK